MPQLLQKSMVYDGQKQENVTKYHKSNELLYKICFIYL